MNSDKTKIGFFLFGADGKREVPYRLLPSTPSHQSLLPLASRLTPPHKLIQTFIGDSFQIPVDNIVPNNPKPIKTFSSHILRRESLNS